MKLYIAGPISGIPDLNRGAFDAAKVRLCGIGRYEVCSPFENGLTVDAEWEDHLRADLHMLLDCDGVALLSGWLDSRGARLEEHVAHALGMPRRSVAEWLKEAS